MEFFILKILPILYPLIMEIISIQLKIFMFCKKRNNAWFERNGDNCRM